MLSGGGQGGAVNPWLVDETEETRGLSFGEIKQQQQRIIEGLFRPVTQIDRICEDSKCSG